MARYQILPPLAADDHDRLAASIRERGVEVPVIKDEHGEIIDGHNRAMIADSLGIRYPSEVRVGLSEAQKRLLSVDLNLARRQLNDAQKVVLGQSIEADVAEVSRLRMLATQSNHAAQEAASSLGQMSIAATPTTSRDEVAKKVGLGSGRTYERAKQVIEAVKAQPDGDRLMRHVESGDWDIPEAKKELEHRGVEWRKPANVTAMPRPGERASAETVDAVAEMFLEPQLPHMFAQVVLGIQLHIADATLKATRTAREFPWDRVTDEMRADKSITDALRFIDADFGRLAEVLHHARLSQAGIRSVK
ncbi:MAG: ParB N-terminal domain-containing protein [Thermomicrobiales bacterium]